MIFNRTLPPDQLKQVTQYLSAKFEITLKESSDAL